MEAPGNEVRRTWTNEGIDLAGKQNIPSNFMVTMLSLFAAAKRWRYQGAAIPGSKKLVKFKKKLDMPHRGIIICVKARA